MQVLMPCPQNDVTIQNKSGGSLQCRPIDNILQGVRTLLALVSLEKCEGNEEPGSMKGTCVPWGVDPASLSTRKVALTEIWA